MSGLQEASEKMQEAGAAAPAVSDKCARPFASSCPARCVSAASFPSGRGSVGTGEPSLRAKACALRWLLYRVGVSAQEGGSNKSRTEPQRAMCYSRRQERRSFEALPAQY